jgi:hypothetical protein
VCSLGESRVTGSLGAAIEQHEEHAADGDEERDDHLMRNVPSMPSP